MAAKSGESLGTTVIRYLQMNREKKYLLRRSWDNWAWKQLFADRARDGFIKAQTMKVGDHAEYGSDIAVSKFVVHTLKGRVKDHAGQWISSIAKLPGEFRDDFWVTGIDASSRSLVTEGTDNFVGLDHIEFLDLSRNPALDDFACDQLSRQFRDSKTLKSINLSHNPLISVYGLEVLLRIHSLEDITATHTQASKHENIDLFTFAAQDECGCRVIVYEDGQQYKNEMLNPDPVPRLESDVK